MVSIPAPVVAESTAGEGVGGASGETLVESERLAPLVLPCWDGFSVPGVTLVRSVREAERVAALVASASSGDADVVHAWDTEVVDLDLDSESPVGHGRVICASFYSGPQFDWGNGPRVWIDASADEGDAPLRAFAGVLGDARTRTVWHNFGFDRHVLFNHGVDVRGFWADTMHLARLENTARLEPKTGGGYSLAALSRALLPGLPPKIPMIDLFGRAKRKKNGEESKIRELPHLEAIQRAEARETRAAWIEYSTRDARVTWDLYQRLWALLGNAAWAPDPACFSDIRAAGSVNALTLRAGERDAEADPPVLTELYARVLRPFGELLTDMERRGMRLDVDAIKKAGEAAEADRALTIERFLNWAVSFTGRPDLRALNVHSDMQKAQLIFGLPRADNGDDVIGAGVGKAALGPTSADDASLTDSQEHGERGQEEDFVLDVVERPGARKTAAAMEVEVSAMSTGTGIKRGRPRRSVAPSTLDGDEGDPANVAYLGGGGGSSKSGARSFTSSAHGFTFEPGLIGLDSSSASDSDGWAGSVMGAESSDSEAEVDGAGGAGGVGGAVSGPLSGGNPLGPTGYIPRIPARGEDVCAEYEFETENVDGWVEPGKTKARRKRPLMIPSLLLPAVERTPKGRAAATGSALKKLIGKPIQNGPAYTALVAGGCPPEAALESTMRISDLLAIASVDTVLETFIRPLEAAATSDVASRVHCSLNLNTETGRLSARRPNLQNQPSLERDRFFIRRAFVAPPGRALVVADYGQLELRVLAHLTDCASMLRAFELGGDFHSRTAMGMYASVREAVDAGRVALEDGGATGVPLLKDVFKEERRKAKILNFSIAYGKTAFGLSKDWGVSLAEAEATVRAWYADRPEVLAWQQRTKDAARRTGRVHTMLGRHRDLPGINSRRLAGHAERAAINTPIQGSAADIVMSAMLRLRADEELRAAGWEQVLQVHDEVVLEGPKESADAALRRTVACMESPFDAPLRVALTVDAKIVGSWGDAK